MLFALLLPLFLLAALGWALARSRWLAPGWQAGLGELTVKLLVPALLLNGAYTNGVSSSVPWQALGAYYLPLIGLFLLFAHIGRSERSAPRALAATYSNNAFVGIPVLVQAFGSDSLRYAFPVIAFHSLVGFTLYYLSASTPGQSGRLVRSVVAALKNPIVVSLFIGFALKLAGIVLPGAVLRMLDMLSAAALPCSLLVLGASLAGLHAQRIGESLALVTTKLVLLPLLVLALARYLFELPPAATAVLVVMAACPVGVNAALVVQADGKDAAVASSAILLSSVACSATIPLWLWALRAQ